MLCVYAGVQNPDYDSLAIVGVPPQPGIFLQSEELRSVSGAGVPEMVWKRSQKLLPLGHHGEVIFGEPHGKPREDLSVGMDEAWLIGAGERRWQEGILPPAVVVLAAGVDGWPQQHNVCAMAWREACT